MTAARRTLLACVIVAAAALPAFAPALVRGEVFTFRDHSDYFQPLRLYTTQHLRAGRLPLWNPYNASGEPWLANPQTGVFYPPAWLFVALPFGVAYVLYLFVHVGLLGCGAYVLFRRDASAPSAVVGAVALMLSGPVLSLLDVSNNLTTLAWLPWIAVRARADRERARPLVAGILLALAFLAGEPFYAAVAAIVYCAIVRRARPIVIAGVSATGLSAVQLLPFIEMIRGSNRLGGFAATDVLRASMPWRDWSLLVLPPRFAWHTETFLFDLYASAFVIALGIAGGVAAWREGRRRMIGGVVLSIVVIAVVASGPALLAQLPLTIFRYPSRVVPLAIFPIAGLAVLGWERMRPRSLIVDAVLIAAIAVDLIVAARPMLVSAPFTRARVPYAASMGRDRKILQDYRDVSLRGASREAWVSGYINLLDLRFAALTAAPVTSRRYLDLYAESLRSIETLRDIGVGWVLTTDALTPPFLPVAHAGAVTAYRVAGARAMAYVITSSGSVIPARALALDASRALVRVTTSTPGLVVLTQNDAPGWSVTIDGAAARGTKYLDVLRAVNVPAGTHEIVWRYAPQSLRLGAIVTMIALASTLAGVRRGW